MCARGIIQSIKDPGYVLKQIYFHLTTILTYPKFRELSDAAITKDQALDFAFSFKRFGVSILPAQVREEISNFLSIAEREKPRVILEIGTGKGGTLFLFSRISTSDAKLISVDLPSYPKWNERLLESFLIKDQMLKLVRGDSHTTDTFDRVTQSLDHCNVDLLFIDGDHRYNGVKRDFELYSKLVRQGGIVAFHDIAYPRPNIDAEKFWNEIKHNYEHIEIIDKKNPCGIGILFMNSIEKVNTKSSAN